METRLAAKCNFDAAQYEDRACMILHALESTPEVLQKYTPTMLAAMDDLSLLPENTMLSEFCKKRNMSLQSFKYLVDKLTGDTETEMFALMQCRKCGYQGDFIGLQTRCSDEPMTLFCWCLNPECKHQWKL